MNEELQKKLIEWTEKIGDIAVEQIPDFAQQIINYEIWSATIWMYTCIGILSILGVLFLLSVVLCCFEDSRERETLGCFIGFIFMGCIIPTYIIFHNYSQIKKCEVAPKLVIIDYIKGK